MVKDFECAPKDDVRIHVLYHAAYMCAWITSYRFGKEKGGGIFASRAVE